MQIIVNHEECTGCGVCARVCPQKILESGSKEKVKVLDEPRCMGCFGCEDECPSNAIRLLRTRLGESATFEPSLATKDSCDVVVVGAGPAGLGAAIACARAGLETIVCERLPNRKLSHHTDGGVLYALPWICSVETSGDKIIFPELEISFSTPFTELELYGLIGPAGLATDNRFPPNLARGLAANKDDLVDALVREAEKAGAGMRFNAKVEDFLKDGDRFNGVKLADGSEITAKVTVTADGILGKMSEKAGLPCNREKMAYAQILAYEFEDNPGLPRGMLYINGELGSEPGMPPAMAGIGVTRHIEVVFVTMSEKRYYNGEKPLDYYLNRFIASDPRVKEVLGSTLEDKSPQMLTGCRVVFRKTNRDIVRDGLVSVGDAFVAGGELGNVPALAHGVHAGRVIGKAVHALSLGKEALSPIAEFIDPKLDQLTTKNSGFKTMPMRLTEKKTVYYFQIMRYANYPTMLFGTPRQQSWMFTKLMFRNTLKFIRHPKMFRLMMG